MIKRKLDVELRQLMKTFPAVAILGARQVGKTTLAKSLAKKKGVVSEYIDLENPNDRRKLADTFSYLTSVENKLVIIDEVQVMPEIFSVLRSVIDAKRKNGRFILLGSASPQLVKGVSESLAGRIYYTELTPVSYTELPSRIGMNRHWFRGGFPNALMAKTDRDYVNWMNGFIKSYIERDLNFLFDITFSVSMMRNFWSMLAHANGGIWNAEMFARSLGVSAPTVLRYLEFLEGAFLVHRLPAFFTNAKKRLVKAPKVYIRDSGLLHRLLNLSSPDDIQGHPAIGASWEGYVVEQIKNSVHHDIQLHYYRTQVGAECDLVFVRGHKPVATVEIKFSNAPAVSKGYYQSIADLKCKTNFIVTPGSDDYSSSDGVRVCSMDTFINKYLPLIK